jgi:hypothetical protein
MRVTATHNYGTGGRHAPGRRHAAARGLGMVEMMLALAISAGVLTAVAVALDVSFRSFGINQENANLMQRCRLAMHRITTDIRTASGHEPMNVLPKKEFTEGVNTTDTRIKMIHDGGVEITYEYDPVNKLLTSNNDGNELVIARGVEAFEVKFEPVGGVNSVSLLRASVLLTVRTAGKEVGVGSQADQTVTMSTSVMPRRNVW